MGLVAVDSSNGGNPPSSGHLIGQNYQLMLKESIVRFLDESQRGISDFSGFSSIFFRLLQARIDPPLETIWFYSAVSFKRSNGSEDSPLARVVRARELFQFLCACSASCNGLTSIAVLAPVLFELHGSIAGLSEKKLSAKKEKKTVKEIECLIEGVVSYISICACRSFDGYGDGGSVGLVPCFADLVRVWTVDEKDGNGEAGQALRVFFPLVSDEIRDGFGDGEVEVNYLAGVVAVEAFLMRLCLKFRGGVSKHELQKELKSWAVGSITGFRSCYFFGMLLRLLLEPTLPVNSLLGSEDEACLRGVLYDVALLVEYSFLGTDEDTSPTADDMKDLAMRRLILVHEATQVARSNGDQTKAISYINAFSRSRLSSELMKWASNQIGMEQKPGKLNITTPHSLIKLLLNLENQGVRVFGNEISKFREKLVIDIAKSDYEYPTKRASKDEADDLFYIDTKGQEMDVKGEEDQEMVESIDSAFLAAAQTMKVTANDVKRKRKQKGNAGTKVKFLKYHLDEQSVTRLLPSGDDDDDDAGNVGSDEDVEEMED